MKFGRTYVASIQVNDGGDFVTIPYPITLTANICRSILSSANTGTFRFYNLNETTRRKVLHDRYDILHYRKITILAGYEGEPKLPIIFQGNIISAYSYKQSTDWITEVEAFDGGFGIINGNISNTIPSGYNFKDALINTIKTMPNIKVGAIGNLSPDNSRGITLMGNSWDVINRITGETPNFIDNETAHILNFNEYIDQPGTVLLINSETGLLGTPRRFDARLDVSILFEPSIIVGQRVKLESLETYYNGMYKVIGVNHRVTISGSVGGEAVTTLNLWKGTSLLAVTPQ